MNYYLFLMQLFFLLLAIFLTWQALLYYRRMSLYKKLRTAEFPPEWLNTLRKIPHFNLLSREAKESLRPKMLYFAMSKEFICVKCEVTEEMKAVVSFFASLMVMGYEVAEPFEDLDTVLIYPHDVVVKGVHEKRGVLSEGESLLEGESTPGTILLAWSEAKHEAFHHGCGNVIVHELAHLLDFDEYYVEGMPPLEGRERSRWSDIFSRHFDELLEKAAKGRDWGEYRFIGEYASESEAEFFAVLSERFFQCPVSLKKHFPDLYNELRSFYRIDTADIFSALG